jgi:hypothetical protein
MNANKLRLTARECARMNKEKRKGCFHCNLHVPEINERSSVGIPGDGAKGCQLVTLFASGT